MPITQRDIFGGPAPDETKFVGEDNGVLVYRKPDGTTLRIPKQAMERHSAPPVPQAHVEPYHRPDMPPKVIGGPNDPLAVLVAQNEELKRLGLYPSPAPKAPSGGKCPTCGK